MNRATFGHKAYPDLLSFVSCCGVRRWWRPALPFFGVVSPWAIGGCATPGFRGGLRLEALACLTVDRRLAVERRLVLVRRFTVVRRFEVARRFPLVRCFAAVRRFTGRRFFRTNATLPNVSYASPYIASCPGKHSNKENLPAKGATSHCETSQIGYWPYFAPPPSMPLLPHSVNWALQR